MSCMCFECVSERGLDDLIIPPNERLVMRWHPLKYVIKDVDLWAVERDDGYIDKYCSSKIDAIERCVELNT